ncbi:MAG: hypothetical protein RLZZ540_1910 [Bacteroidota bacterium]|jgi:hypothetical protein
MFRLVSLNQLNTSIINDKKLFGDYSKSFIYSIYKLYFFMISFRHLNRIKI